MEVYNDDGLSEYSCKIKTCQRGSYTVRLQHHMCDYGLYDLNIKLGKDALCVI